MKADKHKDNFTIEVSNLCPRDSFSSARIQKISNFVLKKEKITKVFLTISLVSDPAIRSLNKKYLAKNLSTDVLAFDLSFKKNKDRYLMGDIVVSLDTAHRSSRVLGVSYDEEVCRYVTHGILHLCGYDDLTPRKKKVMWKRQEALLKKCL